MLKMKSLLFVLATAFATLAFGKLGESVVSLEAKFVTEKHWKSSSLEFAKPELKADVPVALLHGMGDSCFNSGMKHIEEVIKSQLPHDDVNCIPIGDNYEEDTLNAFKLSMNGQVDLFAEKIKEKIGSLASFDALGISQGTLVMRGYIQRYSHRPDYPSARRFISVHGPLFGVAAVPACDPSDETTGRVCGLLEEVTGEIAYTDFMQNSLAQTNYLREPMYIEDFLTTDFLPALNFEKEGDNVRGMQSLEQMVLVKAEKDIVVLPPDSEWFGFFQDGSYSVIETFTETKFFKDDMFGLKTLYEAGKIHFESTPDGHVQFSDAWLRNLITQYWV